MTNLILSHINPIQQEAVTFGHGPLLILAGAGSGKTRTLTHRAAWLIQEKGVAPENVLLLTFTNKAAEEMKGRLKKLLSHSQNIPFAGTFHSFCARVLRIDGQKIGIPKNYLIYDEDDQIKTIKMAMEKLDISSKHFKPSSVLAAISQAKNELISALEYPQYVQGDFQITVARIYLTYQRLLKNAQALDFDDLLLETARLFQKEKEVLEKYQNKYQWVLIDEYQDTNRAQYILTKLLTKKWQNLTVVGDASQSIYSWRGADFRNLMSLQNDFPNLKIINLEQNYRSTQVILDAANQVIRKNTSHPILNLWTKNHRGEKIHLYQAQNEEDEAKFIIKNIRYYPLHNFAVLYRTNAQSRIIEEALLHAGIPYLLVGGVRFYERREIKDCLAYLRLIANPQDIISYQRIEKLGKNRLKKFLELKKETTKTLTTLELLEKILQQTAYLKKFNENNLEDVSRIENIQELHSVAAQFSDLNQFLENVALIQQEYIPNKQTRNSITLMTAHAAKGTEFPIVFMIGMEEGLFPHSRSLTEKDGLEEERRLCYVGMTRAKEKLFMSYTQRRFYFGEKASNPLSRFVVDIPPHLIQWERYDC